MQRPSAPPPSRRKMMWRACVLLCPLRCQRQIHLKEQDEQIAALALLVRGLQTTVDPMEKSTQQSSDKLRGEPALVFIFERSSASGDRISNVVFPCSVQSKRLNWRRRLRPFLRSH